MIAIRDELEPDCSRVSAAEIEARRQIESRHGQHDDGTDVAIRRALGCAADYATGDIPTDADHVGRLREFGLPDRDANAIEAADVWTICELRWLQHEVGNWPQCGEATVRAVRAALKRLDEARRR